MNRLRLIEATPHDLDDIMRLETEGFAPGNREERAVYERRIAVFPEGSLMGEYDGKTVGCIFSEIWRAQESLIPGDFKLGHDIAQRHDPLYGAELYITSMTIDPAYRGQQLGFDLFNGCIEYVLARFPRVESALLLVNETWTQAHEIYKQSGFHEIMRLSQFFSPYPGVYEDGIVMRKRLT